MKAETSIIIPFYKNFTLLEKAIKSVINQTYKNYEIIIINDNPKSKKNLFLLKKLAFKNSRIKIIINKKNIGAGYSRNKGINLAIGKYIAFLDSDDVWKKNKLRLQLNFMKKNNFVATHTSYEIVNLNNKFLKKRVAKDLNYQDLINSCDIGLSTVILSKKLFSQNLIFPKLKTKEDYVVWLKITKKGTFFKGLNKSLTIWTKRPGSLSNSTYQKLKDAFTVYYNYEGYNLIKTFYNIFILSINFLKKK